jgi:hypothetical protein
MKGIKVYLVDYDCWHSKPVSFERIKGFKIKKGFLCITLEDDKAICYNLSRIEKFEVESDDN